MPPRRPRTSPLSLVVQRVDALSNGAPADDTVPSGFPSLDKLLGGGFRRGDLVATGGDVASGKSAFAIGVAIRAAQQGRRAVLYSGEMIKERLMERALAIEGRARVDDMRRGSMDDAARSGIAAAAIRFRDGPPVLDRLPPGGLDALADAIRKLKNRELIIVDSLQSLAQGRDALDEELANAVRELKVLALDLHATVLVTAHLPGLQRERRDPRPVLDDFGVLGAVKQHADVVLGLFREEMYQSSPGIEGATELIVAKNRNGATGYVDLFFYRQWLRFEDVLDPDR